MEKEYSKPYYTVTANDVEFKTYTQSGVNISTQILDRFNIDYNIKLIQ